MPSAAAAHFDCSLACCLKYSKLMNSISLTHSLSLSLSLCRVFSLSSLFCWLWFALTLSLFLLSICRALFFKWNKLSSSCLTTFWRRRHRAQTNTHTNSNNNNNWRKAVNPVGRSVARARLWAPPRWAGRYWKLWLPIQACSNICSFALSLSLSLIHYCESKQL